MSYLEGIGAWTRERLEERRETRSLAASTEVDPIGSIVLTLSDRAMTKTLLRWRQAVGQKTVTKRMPASAAELSSLATFFGPGSRVPCMTLSAVCGDDAGARGRVKFLSVSVFELAIEFR